MKRLRAGSLVRSRLVDQALLALDRVDDGSTFVEVQNPLQ